MKDTAKAKLAEVRMVVENMNEEQLQNLITRYCVLVADLMIVYYDLFKQEIGSLVKLVVRKNIVLAVDLAVPERHPLTSDDTLLTALRRLGGREVNLLPVVRPDDRERLEGTVSRQDLMAAYERALTAEGH